MPLDRHRTLAVEPRAPRGEDKAESASGGQWVADAIGRGGRARADLDTDIRTAQLAERVLVCHVVAEEQHGACGQLHAQRVERGALVGRQHGQLDDRLSGRHIHLGPGRRAGAYRVEHGFGYLGRRGAQMHRHRRRLALKPYPWGSVHDLDQRGLELLTESDLLRRETLDEADVEFAAVRPDEMHLSRQAGQRCEVTQGPTGHHGRGRLGQRGQRAQRSRRLRQWHCL